MEIIGILLNVIIAAGSLLAGIAAIIVIPKTIKSSMVNSETLYGDEAKERYDEMKVTISSDCAVEIPPSEYGGGRLNTPKFELTRFVYDKQTMGLKKKSYRRVAKFYEEEGGKIFVKGWYLK